MKVEFTEFTEDARGRSWRVARARRDAFACARACATYGVPLSIVAAIVLWSFAAERTDLYAVILLVPVAFGLMSYLAPNAHRLFRNRWRVTDTRLVVRGEKIGGVSWRHVTTWSMTALPELPGYYLLRLVGKYDGPVDLVLSEAAFAPQIVKESFARHIKAEPGGCTEPRDGTAVSDRTPLARGR